MTKTGTLFDALKSPRFWTFFATVCTRGVGFLTSFSLARVAGADSLGAYSTVLNTASAVTSPFAQVLANNATLTAAQAHREGPHAFKAHARGHILLGFGLSLPACLLLAWSLQSSNEAQSSVWEMMLVAGTCVAMGQVLAGVVQGFYQGAGQFLVAARVTAVVAALMGILVIPAVWFGGVGGAFYIAGVVAVLPALLLGVGLFWTRKSQPHELTSASMGDRNTPLRNAIRRLLQAMPSVGATAVNAAVNWVCTIYFVRNGYGLAGVGVVAVAIQWSTLVLMPATSWGGLTLKALTDSVSAQNVVAVREVVLQQAKKNLKATGLLAALLGLGSGLIAQAYGLSGTDLWLLLCVNAVAALVASVNNVFERLLLCLNAQPRWLMQSLVAFGVQVAFTASFIHMGLVVVALGVLLAGVTQAALCTFSLNGLLARAR